MVVAAVEQPDFVRNARSVGAKRVVIALYIDASLPFLLLLVNNIAKYTTLFFLKPFTGGAQLVLNAARHKNRAGDFSVGVRPFFASEFALILKNAEELETNVLLEVSDPGNPD